MRVVRRKSRTRTSATRGAAGRRATGSGDRDWRQDRDWRRLERSVRLDHMQRSVGNARFRCGSGGTSSAVQKPRG